MKSFIIKEGAVWLALVALTVVGFYNAGMKGRSVAYLVLAIGLAKFFLIFFDFMEMKHAHRVWQVSMQRSPLASDTSMRISAGLDWQRVEDRPRLWPWLETRLESSFSKAFTRPRWRALLPPGTAR
jgi:hypothetical protein